MFKLFNYFPLIYKRSYNNLYNSFSLTLYTDDVIWALHVGRNPPICMTFPPVLLGDHVTISHADAMCQILVVAQGAVSVLLVN